MLQNIAYINAANVKMATAQNLVAFPDEWQNARNSTSTGNPRETSATISKLDLHRI